MAYCILRAKKLKSFGAVAGSVQHTLREIQTPNADESRRHRNQLIGPKTSGGVMAVLRELLPQKRRKDAVIAIEYLITASPEFFAGHTRAAYFKVALEFLKQRHGKQHLVSAALHLDETTPHLVAYVVPINAAGKLAAKDFLGGREKLSQLQTDFFQKVGAKFGLERGVKGSRATHQKVQQFYTQIGVEGDLKPLGKMDKFAGALGLKTDASIAREEAEKALQAKAIETGRNALLAARLGQKQAEKSLENAKQAKADASAIAEFSRLDLEREREKTDALTHELRATQKQLQDARDQAATLYERIQASEFPARTSSLSTPTPKEQPHGIFLQTTKSRMA